MITECLWRIGYTTEEDKTEKTDPLWQKIGKKETAKKQKSEGGNKKQPTAIMIINSPEKRQRHLDWVTNDS